MFKKKIKVKIMRVLEHLEFTKQCGMTKHFSSQNTGIMNLRQCFSCLFYKIILELGNKGLGFLLGSETNEGNIFSVIPLTIGIYDTWDRRASSSLHPSYTESCSKKSSELRSTNWQIQKQSRGCKV